ncbi:hypothetical protein EJB05_02715, partial [Eragrostis curvula]
MNPAASASQPPPSPSCLRCPGWRHVLSFSSYLSGAPGRSVQVVQMSMDGSFFTERYSGLLDCKRGNGPAKEEKG